MKRLQTKYNCIQFLYWITNCTIFGYVAIFLQYKGLSNTEIGIVTAMGSIMMLILSANISNLPNKYEALTPHNVILGIYAILFASFSALYFMTLPKVVVMALYIALLFLSTCVVPFLSQFAMDYVKMGHDINFGLARGLGSFSYASSAFLMGYLVEWLEPSVIYIVFIVSSILFIINLLILPNSTIKNASTEKPANPFSLITKYKKFFLFLLGFGFAITGATSLSTYLINIVKKLGGDSSFYGIAIFFMAASETPFMTMTYRLKKKFGPEKLIVFGLFMYIFRNFLIALAPNLIVLLIGMVFQGCSYGLLFATYTYYCNDALAESDQMAGQTLITMMANGFGFCLGNYLGGVLQDTLGLQSMLIFAMAVTLVGALIGVCTYKFMKED